MLQHDRSCAQHLPPATPSLWPPPPVGQLLLRVNDAKSEAELARLRSRQAAEEAREPTSLAEAKYEVSCPVVGAPPRKGGMGGAAPF